MQNVQISDRLGFSHGNQQFLGDGLFLLDQRGDHAVYEPLGQLVGPLVYGLVGNANCVGGCGRGAAEQFNGFRLEHGSIEPQFNIKCNPSSVRGCDHPTMVDLGERLAALMRERGVSTSQLSTAVGVSYQGIKKIVTGKTNEIKAANLLKIANYLRVNPVWLRTGEGTRELDEDDVLVARATVEPYDGQGRREVDDSEWALLEDFKMLPDDEKAALRATLKAKADHVRKIVNEYLGKRGISATPVPDSKVEAAFGPPPPPTGASSWKKHLPVPDAPKPAKTKEK